METFDSFQTRQPRSHELRPSAEAGKRMGFYEACCDTNIRLHPVAIQENRIPIGGGATIYELGVIFALMINDAVTAGDLGSNHTLQFPLSRRPVRARGNQDLDSLRRHLIELFENWR
jgi:hypothetical protein